MSPCNLATFFQAVVSREGGHVRHRLYPLGARTQRVGGSLVRLVRLLRRKGSQVVRVVVRVWFASGRRCHTVTPRQPVTAGCS